jgi:hypothetical protein
VSSEYEDQLGKIAKQMKKGVKPPHVSTRTFIHWFNVHRRTYWNVQLIRQALYKHQLETTPDFESAYVDSQITFTQISGSASDVGDREEITDAYKDPTYRIGKLASANRTPLSIKPDDTIIKAVTLMMKHNFSQLPVMTTDREVKGIISWESLGRRLVLRNNCEFVRECMVQAKVISSDESIFTAVDDIIANQYVLIYNTQKIICGIVTTSDLSQQFRQLGEPYLLLREIENYIRRMIQDKFTLQELKAACKATDTEKEIGSPADLTLGDHIYLIADPRNWKKLNLLIDRLEFTDNLDEIRRIRNDVMHFDTDGIENEDLLSLREFAHLMQQLASVGAI